MNISDKVLFSSKFSSKFIRFWLILYLPKVAFSVLFKTKAF